MKSFQSLASTLIQGVHSTYSEYSRGYQQHSTDNSTAILEEDERERRLTDGAKEEQAKEVLAAKTSVLFHEAAIPHNSMAAVVEKARERRAIEAEASEHNKASHTLSEDERERRISDNLEVQSREAIAAQVSVIVRDAMNTGVRPLRSVTDIANDVQVGSLVEEERARRVADVEESQLHEALAAKTSTLIQNRNLDAKSEDIDHSLTREISNMIISEAHKQHVLDTNALMTPSLVHPQQPANMIHPGIETPLVLREDTPLEVRLEEPVINEIAPRDSCPLTFHDEVHTSAPSAMLEGLIEHSVAAPVVENDVQYRTETFSQPEVQYVPEPQIQMDVQQFEAPAQFQPAMQYEAETDFRTLAVPAHTENHAVSASVKLYPMIFQNVEAPMAYASTVQAPVEVVQTPWTPETAHVAVIPPATTMESPRTLLVRQQSCPVLATPAASVHTSSLAALQADAMDLTNSAPFTEWVESTGQPSIVNQAPLVPVLVRSLSAKELKQINRNINSHHNDALKEVRKAEKCVMKSEKYAAKGNTAKADKYKREALDHRMRVDQHQHVVVEEKAKLDATNFAAATPAL